MILFPQRFGRTSQASTQGATALQPSFSHRPTLRRFLLMALAALVLTLCGCVGPGDKRPWTTADKVAFGVFASCQLTDALQTMQVADNPRLEERNPLLGKKPSPETVLAVKGAVTLFTYEVVDAVPSHRAAALILPTVLCGAAVANNFNLGVGIDL